MQLHTVHVTDLRPPKEGFRKSGNYEYSHVVYPNMPKPISLKIANAPDPDYIVKVKVLLGKDEQHSVDLLYEPTLGRYVGHLPELPAGRITVYLLITHARHAIQVAGVGRISQAMMVLHSIPISQRHSWGPPLGIARLDDICPNCDSANLRYTSAKHTRVFKCLACRQITDTYSPGPN
jgi:hypothetical protein